MADFRASQDWVAQADDLVTVVRALEPAVLASARSLTGMESTSYSVSAGDFSLSKQDDLDDAVSRLPGPVTYLWLTHATSLSRLGRSGKYHSFSLSARRSYKGGVVVELYFHGPDTPAAHGLWEQARNRIAAEVAHQDQHNWAAAPLHMAAGAPAGLAAEQPPLGAVSPQARRGLTHNPWVIAIAGGLLVTVVGGIIVAYLTQGDSPTNPSPTPTSVTTSTTSNVPRPQPPTEIPPTS